MNNKTIKIFIMVLFLTVMIVPVIMFVNIIQGRPAFIFF